MSSNTNSRSSPSGGNGTNSNSDRPRLTDAEKKQNHIASEQKRRQAIRMGFDRLAAMTPGMHGMGRSEATVLSNAVNEIKRQTEIKERLKRKLMKENPDITSDWFEKFYTDNVPAAAANVFTVRPGAAPAPASSSALNSPSGSNTGSTGSSSQGKSKRIKTEK